MILRSTIKNIFKDECGVSAARVGKHRVQHYSSFFAVALLRWNFCTLRALRQRVAGEDSVI